MGVKGISKVVKKYGKNFNNLEFLSGSKIAIDTSIFMYRFKYNTKSSEDFLRKFLIQLRNFKIYNITPIYVFDGVAPEIKKETHDSRNETREKAEARLAEEKDPEKAENISKNIIRITSEDRKCLKELLEKYNIQYICPKKTEGEKYCAYMNKKGIADYVLSNDYDSIAFGCKKLVFSNNDNTFTLYETEEILKSLEITEEQYVDVCIASGCDYYPKGIDRVGPSKALKFVKTSGIKNWECNTIDSDYIDEIKKIFLEDPEEEFDSI